MVDNYLFQTKEEDYRRPLRFFLYSSNYGDQTICLNHSHTILYPVNMIKLRKKYKYPSTKGKKYEEN